MAAVTHYLLGVHIDPEDEGSTFLRNVIELLPNYTVSISQETMLFIVTCVRTRNLTPLQTVLDLRK
jgi:hypothetical protein